MKWIPTNTPSIEHQTHCLLVCSQVPQAQIQKVKLEVGTDNPTDPANYFRDIHPV